MVHEIKVGEGVWFIPNDVVEEMIANPPAPNTLFDKPVVFADNPSKVLSFQESMSKYYGENLRQ